MSMEGKLKCQCLKAIRKQIADANGIVLEIPECTHEGPCAGTCPRCEAEVRYLETQLSHKRSLGQAVAVAGIAAAMATALVGCGSSADDDGCDYDMEGIVMETQGEPAPPPMTPGWEAQSLPDGSVVPVPKRPEFFNDAQNRDYDDLFPGGENDASGTI